MNQSISINQPRVKRHNIVHFLLASITEDTLCNNLLHSTVYMYPWLSWIVLWASTWNLFPFDLLNIFQLLAISYLKLSKSHEQQAPSPGQN